MFYTQLSTDVISAPVTTPENISAVSTSMRIQFSWSPPPLLKTSTIITSYTLTCRSRVAGVDSVAVTYAEAGTYNPGGFRPATGYNCSIFASNSAGDGPTTDISVITMDESEVLACSIYSNVGLLPEDLKIAIHSL